MIGSGTWASQVLCVSALLLAGTAWAGNTTCASGQLDWYSSVVGESPCVTYQRLRQICNNDYQVPSFRPDTPGDNCDDQVSACCCNTVAFQLSMLCMNCQQDRVAGNEIGIDAGVGAYQLYRGTCGAGTNHSLPQDIQQGVCNLNIRLDNFLYGGWDDGSWFYVYTKESAVRDHAVNNNNTFTHCANQISPSATPTSSSSTVTSGTQSAITSGASSTTDKSGPSATSADTANAGQRSSSSPTGAIAGGVVGGVVVIAAALLGLVCWRRRVRRRGGVTRGIQDPPHSYDIDGPPGVSPNMSTPFMSMVTSSGGAAAPTSEYSTTHVTSPHHAHSPSSWTDLSSAVPQSAYPSSDGLRHTDAGVVMPLSRSASGRLPPAYRSWEDDSNVGSDAQTSHQGSASGQSAPASEVAADPHMPLVPMRLEEKASYSGQSA